MSQYYAILKAKAAEIQALTAADGTVRNTLTPVLDLPPFKPGKRVSEPDAWLRSIAGDLAAAWAHSGPVLIDTHMVGDELIPGRHPLSFLAEEAAAHEVHTIPVVRLNSTASAYNAVDLASEWAGGTAAFRISQSDFARESLADSLGAALDRLQLAPSDVTLIIDLRSLPGDAHETQIFAVKQMLRVLPFAAEWRELVLAGSAIPTDLSAIPTTPGHVLVARGEWALWQRLSGAANLEFPRIPIFGDYGISHPEFAEERAGVRHAPVGLRYTRPTGYLLLRWGSMLRAGSAAFGPLARWLVGSEYYSGPEFSWGDGRILELSERSLEHESGWGVPKTWRAIGTSHHLAMVVNQLRSQEA